MYAAAPSIRLNIICNGIMALNFQAFLDESAPKDASSGDVEFVLAGHIATADAWEEFSEEWRELLPLGTRASNGNFHFKMAEMARTPESRDRVRHFYAVIEKYVLTSISVRVNLEYFARAHERLEMAGRFHNWPPIPQRLWKNPYFYAFRGLLDKFHESMFGGVVPMDEKVEFIFDDKSEKNPILKGWDSYILNRDESVREHYRSPPRFENDQEFLPLQAADLWAWQVRQWYEEDSIAHPPKMEAFDFGKWHGKQRKNIILSSDEETIFNGLQGAVVHWIAESQAERDSFFSE
jgi:hypothetical protein